MASDAHGDNYVLLGRLVRARRERLGVSQDLRPWGGPGEITTRKIEKGDGASSRGQTLTDLESALSWAPGAVEWILGGELGVGDYVPEALVAPDGTLKVVRDPDEAARLLASGHFDYRHRRFSSDPRTASPARYSPKFHRGQYYNDDASFEEAAVSPEGIPSGEAVGTPEIRTGSGRAGTVLSARSTLGSGLNTEDTAVDNLARPDGVRIAQTTYTVGQAVAQLAPAERTARVERVLDLLREAARLLLDEQITPGAKPDAEEQ